MVGKVREATAFGIGIWVAGALAVLSFGQASWFSSLAVPVAVLTAPFMWLVARFHLRDVSPDERAFAGLRLGAIVTAVQCPLDAATLWGIFRLDWLPLPLAARKSLVLGLIVAYFWMLVVPWWEGRRILAWEGDGAHG